jgi:hypothetical protein
LASDASLLLMFEWPPRGERGRHRGRGHGQGDVGPSEPVAEPEAPLALPVSDDASGGQPEVADRKSTPEAAPVESGEASVEP